MLKVRRELISIIIIIVIWCSHLNGIAQSQGTSKYRGCYVDYDTKHKLLDGVYELFNSTLVPPQCISLCAQRSYPFAGLQNGSECYCGHHFPPIIVKTLESECNVQCTGDERKTCGGSTSSAIYETGKSGSHSRPRSTYVGCYKDHKPTVNATGTLLKGYVQEYPGTLSPNICDEICYKKGFLYFGLTLGNFCYCGDQQPSQSDMLTDSKCYIWCPGEPSKKCGGSWELSVYSTGITNAPIEGKYVGCVNTTNFNNASEYKMKKFAFDQTNSPTRCANICDQFQFKYSGVKKEFECYCFDNDPPGPFLENSDCSQLDCPGDPSEACGAGENMKVYRTILQTGNTEQNVQRYLGCYADQIDHQLLNSIKVIIPILTPSQCTIICRERIYPFAGVQNGSECYCGYDFPSIRSKVSEGECESECTGDRMTFCGGPLRTAVYETGISRKNLRPRSAYIGCYRDHKTYENEHDSSILKGFYEEYAGSLTRDMCDQICYKKGFLYFGLTMGRFCHCGDQQPSQGVLLTEDKCYMPCTGEPSKFCGGSWELNIYSTGISNIPHNSKYSACVSNIRDSGVEIEFEKQYDYTNSQRRCFNTCGQQRYKFSGVKNENICYCFNSHPTDTWLEDHSRCDQLQCPENPSETCGDIASTKIHSTFIMGIDAPGIPKYLGCYVDDNPNHKLLDEVREILKTDPALTPKLCIGICFQRGYPFAATQNGYECHCGNDFPSSNSKLMETQCQIKCTGDDSKTCGGISASAVFETGITRKNSKPRSIYLGCYKDKKPTINETGNGVLKGFSEQYVESLTPRMCNEICYKCAFRYFGMTMGNICYCGDQQPPQSYLLDDSKCYQACAGEPSKTCGGSWEVNIYSTGITDAPIESNFIGCRNNIDVIGDSNLEFKVQSFEYTNSPKRCVNFCSQLGYRFSGVTKEVECYCFHNLPDYIQEELGINIANYNECNQLQCPGDPSETCGNNFRMKIYKHMTNTLTTSKGSTFTDNHQKYVGCYVDQPEHRLISGASKKFDTSLTPVICANTCAERRYPFSGVQNGDLCYCGHNFPSINSKSPEIECKTECTGDRRKMCGGMQRISVYETGITKINSRPRSTYLGCFRDHKTYEHEHENSILKGFYEEYAGSLTPDICDHVCYKKGFLYFGLTMGRFCHCGDQRPPQSVLLTEEKCYKPCDGQPTKNCGGSWELNIYLTGISDIPHSEKYIGCVQNLQDIGYTKYLVHTNSGRRCMNICGQREFKYSAVNETICHCFNTAPLDTALETPNKCEQLLCPGNPSETCGDISHMKIYRTFVPGDAEIVTKEPEACERSVTSVNGEYVCKNQNIFSNDFNQINTAVWSFVNKMASKPDYEFVRYGISNKNAYTKEGKLFMKPILLSNDRIIKGSVKIQGCTGRSGSNECERKASSQNILPPIESARLTTEKEFSFRYGTVEIKAKLPKGDWIIPEIWLEPKDSVYGQDYAGGKIKVAFARGNSKFVCGGKNFGIKTLEGGLYAATSDGSVNYKRIFNNEVLSNWSDSVHIFSVHWTPENISFLVDGVLQQLSDIENRQQIDERSEIPKDNTTIWNIGTKLAPFDKEFYLSVGLSVGGTRDFSDECNNNGKRKPWLNNDLNAMLQFWEDRKNWISTWNGENTALQIHHIIINAL